MSSRRAIPLANRWLIGFGVAYILGGIVLLLMGAMGYLPRHLMPNNRAGIPLLGTVFLIAGCCMIGAAARKERASQRALFLRSQYPEEPWRWRDVWADGVIAPSGPGMIPVSIIALLWFGFLGRAGYRLWMDSSSEPTPEIPLALVAIIGVGLPLISVVIITWVMRRTVQIARFGRPRMHLQTMPAALGGWLRGYVLFARSPSWDASFTVRVRCLRRAVPGQRHSAESTQWSAEQVVVGRAADDPACMRVDVVQPLPADGAPSDDQVRWVVQISCDHPGGNFSEFWEVPVFVVPGAEAARVTSASPVLVESAGPLRGVRIEDGDAGVVIRFPAALNLGWSLAILAIAAISAVDMYSAWREGWRISSYLVAPLIMFVAFAALRGLLKTTEIHAHSRGVDIVSGLLGLGLRRRTIGHERISAVGLRTIFAVAHQEYRQLDLGGGPIGPLMPSPGPAGAVRRAVARGLGLES